MHRKEVKTQKKLTMGSLVYKTVKSSALNACLVLWSWGEGSAPFYSYFTWFSNLDFLIFHSWPAPFWEHIVRMFWCCLKALWDAGVDWKLSVLLKWAARELGLNSCHPLTELLSFMNYFPCHLEQERCHGSENSWWGALMLGAYAPAHYHIRLKL